MNWIKKTRKKVYVKNDVTTSVIVHCGGEKKKKRKERKTGGFRKKLDSRICDFRKRRTQTQIKNRNNICKRKNTWRIFC